VDSTVVEAKIVELLGRRGDRWTVEASPRRDVGWLITLTHPASAGLVIETGAREEVEAIDVGGRILADCTEIDIATAAPHLEHPSLIAGLRTVATAFEWSSREVRALVFLLFEHDHLTLEEAAWLGGFAGSDAPMEPVSPLG
jgi:hypothetical protein